MVCMFAGLLLGFLGFMVWCGWFWVWFVVGLLLFCWFCLWLRGFAVLFRFVRSYCFVEGLA